MPGDMLPVAAVTGRCRGDSEVHRGEDDATGGSWSMERDEGGAGWTVVEARGRLPVTRGDEGGVGFVAAAVMALRTGDSSCRVTRPRDCSSARKA